MSSAYMTLAADAVTETNTDMLCVDVAIPDLRVHTKAQLLKIFAEYIARCESGLCVTDVEEALIAQEQQSPCGVGGGVAVIQMCCEGLTAPFFMIARMDSAIDMLAVDLAPVDLAVGVVSPAADSGPLHLRRLSRISRMMRDGDFCNRLRGGDTEDALRMIWGAAEPLRRAA